MKLSELVLPPLKLSLVLVPYKRVYDASCQLGRNGLFFAKNIWLWLDYVCFYSRAWCAEAQFARPFTSQSLALICIFTEAHKDRGDYGNATCSEALI